MKLIAALLLVAGPVFADDFRSQDTRLAFPGHLYAGHGRTVTEFDAATGAVVRTFDVPSQILLMAASPDGHFVAAAGTDGRLAVWDATKGKLAWTVQAPTNGNDPHGLDVSADGRIAVGADNAIAVYDAATGRGVRTITLEAQPDDCKFAPDGRLAVLAPGLVFFDAGGAALPEFESTTSESPGRRGANAIGWSADGQRVLSVGGHLVLVDPKRPHVLGDVDHGLGSYGHHIAVTRDGKWAGVSSDGGNIAWFALPSLAVKATWKLDKIEAMAMSSDGKRIAVVQPNQVIAILDAGANTLTIQRSLRLTPPDGSAPPPSAASSAAAPGASPTPGAAPSGGPLVKDVHYAAVVILRENDRTEERARKDDAKACETAVAAALAKLPDSTRVEIDTTTPPLPGAQPYPQGGDVTVPLSTVRDHICHRGLAAGQVVEVGLKAQSAAMWIGRLEHAETKEESTTSMIQLAVDAGGACSKAVAAAKQFGLPASTSVEFSPYTSSLKSPMPLGDIDDKICKVATAFGAKVIGEREAAEKAQYAPYLKVLSGDKAKLMWEKRMLGGENWYGHGGRRLKTPADFAGSDVWYYYVVDRNGITPRWEVEGYIFKGSKKTGVYDTNGPGDTPPNSAFK
jgi:hypothetical protein